MALSYLKMNGAGNDFVILDARQQAFHLAPAQIARIADRAKGIGCDQLIVLDKPANTQARLAMKIFNSDGSASGACGNATRCVARIEMEAGAAAPFAIEVDGELLQAKGTPLDVTVDMGPARLEAREIPLSEDVDTLNVEVGFGLPAGVAVNMGNPHIVFFVPDADAIDLAKIGPQIEHHVLFPERVNVEFVSVKSRNTMRMRVWERGAGITQACGSGACAALVAAARRGLTERKADIVLDGGTLNVEWLDNNRVLLRGPTAHEFSGDIPEALLNGAA